MFAHLLARVRRHSFSVAVAAALLWPDPGSTQSPLVIVKEGTGIYHRAGCPAIRDVQGVLAMTLAQAESRRHKSHPDCDPAAAKPGAEPSKSSTLARQTVYLNDTKYYHRKDCRRLAAVKEVRAASLEEAGKSQWPCPDCRPRVRRRSAEPAVPGTERRGR